MIECVVNFGDARERESFLRRIAGLKGKQRVEISAWRRKRTNPQNAYYWGVVVREFVRFRHSQGESFDAEQAHEFFKMKFLRTTVVNENTGEIMGDALRSTTTLNTSEFAEYLEKVIAWLSEWSIVVPLAPSMKEAA